jgi:hypothetical protein
VKRNVFLFISILLVLTGCSLSEDVTPPPELATRQAAEPISQATQQRPAPETQATQVEETSPPITSSDAGTGSIYGSIENGTEGADLPHGLKVTFIAFDGNKLVFEKEIPVDADGRFEVQDLEIVPGRIFGALTEYQGVRYFNTAGHMLEDRLSLELPLTVFETTTEDSLLVVDRLHLIFDYSIEGVVEVSELLLMTNNGDRTIAAQDGSNAIRVTLPRGFSNLYFADSPELIRFTEDADGFTMHEAFIPGEAVEAYFSFTLPYERSLEYRQPADYPVEAIVILKTKGPPSISGEGLSEVGARDMGGLVMESYRMDPLERGETLELHLSGRHPAKTGSSSTTNLIVGAVALGLTLIALFFIWWRWSQGQESTVEYDDETVLEELRDREALIRAIAALDDRFETGEIEETAYKERRKELKRTLKALIEEAEHD